MTINNEVILSLDKVNVVYKNGRKVINAVSNVSLDIFKGEILGLVGESGSGKSTIAKSIIGINKLSSGEIKFKGQSLSNIKGKKEKKALKKLIQMIFQDPSSSLNERANLDYIISEGLYNFKLFLNEEERVAKVKSMLKSVGLLEDHINRYPHEFSGGQRQRIGIARSLIIEPELVIADEPISSLDVSVGAQILNLMTRMQRERNLTYLFISHDLTYVRYFADRIAVMHRGHIVEIGHAEEIYSNPIHPYTKRLLAAIPQPNPRIERNKEIKFYDLSDLDYGNCNLIEVSENHFVLGSVEQVNVWK